jgi:two-component system alkaline phosphatase synthesis response regulator PhoP
MKKKILVVDDEVGLLAMTLLRLNKTGYDAFGAVNGREALDLARQRMPDLILLDKLMPELKGDEVLKILKKDGKLKHIPVILISAAVEDLEESARASGAAGFLFKPCETSELLDMIKKYTG